DAVFHVHCPRAAAGAIDAVRAAHDRVVLPAITVTLFPAAGFWVVSVLNPSHVLRPPLKSTCEVHAATAPVRAEDQRNANAEQTAPPVESRDQDQDDQSDPARQSEL